MYNIVDLYAHIHYVLLICIFTVVAHTSELLSGQTIRFLWAVIENLPFFRSFECLEIIEAKKHLYQSSIVFISLVIWLPLRRKIPSDVYPIANSKFRISWHYSFHNTLCSYKVRKRIFPWYCDQVFFRKRTGLLWFSFFSIPECHCYHHCMYQLIKMHHLCFPFRIFRIW